MNDNFFIDTNIFIYSIDQHDKKKQKASQKLITHALVSKKGFISTQVIQETLNIFFKKKLLNTSEIDILFQYTFKPLCQVFVSIELQEKALKIFNQYKFSFYDSLIVAAALETNCKTLYTEDLQHNQKIMNLTIKNPFIK